MQSPFSRFVQKALGAFVCAAAVFAAGCHNNNNDSGYGIGFVTLTGEPGAFSSYTVNVDSVTLTGKTVGLITAVSTVETVDFTKITNIAELWDAASIPNDTYTSATITLDYTAANIAVLINGIPKQATVVDWTGAALTTISITINLDPNNPLVLDPTYATTSGKRLAFDFDLAASNHIILGADTATVVVRPFITVATSASDMKPIRVRGPLTNSSLYIGTYTVYVRPFYDEVDSLGQLTIFNYDTTRFLINGNYYTGASGLSVLSQLSAGTTVTAAYTTYEPTSTPTTTAAKFNATYVVAGSTLEDYYTQGLEGDVVARTGDTLTLRGSTLSLNDGTSQYNEADALVLLGPSTIVTADNNITLTGLSSESISVGQHIIARGIYELPASGVVTLDATGSSSTNTGSVRLISTQLFGSLLSSASGDLAMDLQAINNYPSSDFDFGGNGTTAAQNPVPASFLVNTTNATIPAGIAVGGPVWVDGFTTPFGMAPPDFTAFSVSAESQEPATLHVLWSAPGSGAPFTSATDAGLEINVDDAHFYSGVIQIGAENIDLKTLPATLIVPVPAPAATALPEVFLPLFSIGNPITASELATTTTTVAGALEMYNTYATFLAKLAVEVAPATPVIGFSAGGTYDRSTNTFTASRINVVL